MCESDRNSEAKSFLQSLENTTILKHCYDRCRQRQYSVQLFLCSYILFLYASVCDRRCCKMLQHAGLLEALLVMIKSFQPDADRQVSMATNYALQVLQSLLQCTHPLERIIRAGVRQALDVMLHKIRGRLQCNVVPSRGEVYNGCRQLCQHLSDLLRGLDIASGRVEKQGFVLGGYLF